MRHFAFSLKCGKVSLLFSNEGVNCMANKKVRPTFSIYIPKKAEEKKPVERLMRLSKKRDRSINYLVVEAILQYLDKEERKK